MNLVSSQSNEFDFFFEHPVQWIHRFNGYITVQHMHIQIVMLLLKKTDCFYIQEG